MAMVAERKAAYQEAMLESYEITEGQGYKNKEVRYVNLDIKKQIVLGLEPTGLFYSANIFVAFLFHFLGVVINWWKILFVFIAFLVLGFIYFKATVKQMLFYLSLCLKK